MICLSWARAYNGARHYECPPTGSGIGLDSLEHRHIMFDLLGIDSACSVVVHAALLVIVDRSARGGGLHLDLRRWVRLLVEVIHVDERFLIET
jgi:hypothetical protein